ncbi:MAG: bacteriohemerythrin [Methylobacteriaceae bacterium]|nr:bacteriohemerythrin [Rhodoblastus sp.]MCC0003931.1 bacteriohemerythrin [Methylobacteriaceae bacterium]
MLIEWKDKYRTGIAEVDHEHQELVALINALHEEAKKAAEADVEGFFGDLLAAISAHFALEERAMREAAYPEYSAHKRDHEKLLDDLRDIMDLTEEAGAPQADALGAAIDAWFTTHFATFDARLHAMPIARR